MNQSLTILGGIYYEKCIDPESIDLYGSGLRAAAALSKKNFFVELISCAGNAESETIKSICESFGINLKIISVPDTIVFVYYHPLAIPEIVNYNNDCPQINLKKIAKENILFYGMVEANVSIEAKYVVYDPQNNIPFKDTNSSAEHLALVLNKEQAFLLSNSQENSPLEEIGKILLASQKAEIVVIKDGPHGALVIEKNSSTEIPVFETDYVWPIGSGDIFSAVFAWKWSIEKMRASDAALQASLFTATYCHFKNLPLTEISADLKPIFNLQNSKKIYLAGPFFDISQRWIINEFRGALINFGNSVFSPSHDIGLVNPNDMQDMIAIAEKDIKEIENADTFLAILNTPDLGTSFEIGYARALKKNIIIFSETMQPNDFVMFHGTGCKIVSDFTTAVYMASW